MNEIIHHLPQDQPAISRIQVDGKVDERVWDWFEDMSISTESSSDGKILSTLVGPVADQAALDGLLGRIYTMGFLVISVTRLEPAP